MVLKVIKLILTVSLALETLAGSIAVSKGEYELAQVASMGAIVTVLTIGVIQREENK